MDSSDDVVCLLRAEFLGMPGLRLQFPQAQHLCGVDWVTCQQALDALVEARFLRLESDGAYARHASAR